jgi:membrane associated rhomboid family serine protease
MFNSIVDDFKNAWSRPNNAVVQLVLINLIVFVASIFIWIIFVNTSVFDFLKRLVALPSGLSSLLIRPWTFITYMFVHSGPGHIFWNMVLLYFFGKIIQEYLGSQKVISMYILGGLVGGALYVILYNIIPGFAAVVEDSILIGASAAVLAVVVGAAVFMPDYTFFLFFIGPVKIKYIALIVIIMSIVGLRAGGNEGGDIAHLGGAAIGWIYIVQLRKGNDLGMPILNLFTFIKSFFVRQPKIKVTHRSSSKKSSSKKSSKSSSSKSSKSEQEEIDAILDKISQSGYESLSKEEKQKLFNASKK